MNRMLRKICFLLVFLVLFALTTAAHATLVKGIYITESTLTDSKYLSYLIERAKKVGINTFVVDLEIPSKRYQNNIALLKQNNIHYIARIIVYPDGGTPESIASEKYWAKKYKLIEVAIGYGAEQIQLDYIRYNSKQPASSQNSQNILKIIRWYKNKLAAQNIPLQVDVFGIASFGESKHIGQNIKLFSTSIDALCPMVYPSHFEPYKVHAVTPYTTIFTALQSIKAQFNNQPLPFKLYPYIELSNYRYPLSQEKKLAYIYAQIHAVETAGGDGWYAWSPHNLYDNLFRVLETQPVQ